jgi:release factor glutamine methyltransferase
MQFLGRRQFYSKSNPVINVTFKNIIRKHYDKKVSYSKDLLCSAVTLLRNTGIPNARMEVERLFAISMGYNSWYEWYINGQPQQQIITPPKDYQIQKFQEWISRRALREPFNYIVGFKEFYGRDFKVNRSCLIPRPETELIVDAVKELFYRDPEPINILELGTGSGCIGISLAKELVNPRGIITITDISQEALDVARSNASRWGVMDRLHISKGFWFDFESLPSNPINQRSMLYDCIVSNPPYLSLSDMTSLGPEVSYEPSQALYGGQDGLDAYRYLARHVKNHLRPDGRIVLEIGAYQDEPLISLFSRQGFSLEKSYSDLQSIVRVLVFRQTRTSVSHNSRTQG